mgnify:CR=1 FL=1
MSGFNTKTFRYFDAANANMRDPDWFKLNNSLYEKNVKEPMKFLLNIISIELEEHLHGIDIHNRMVTRPLRPKNKQAEKGINKEKEYKEKLYELENRELSLIKSEKQLNIYLNELKNKVNKMMNLNHAL